MNRICLLIALLCVASMLPPAPPARHKRVHGPTAGDGAARLLAKAAPPPVVPDYNRLLVWKWKESKANSWSNVVFVIRGSPSLQTPTAKWEMVGWTPTNYWLFYINLDDKAMFFHVAVSNTNTRLVSE